MQGGTKILDGRNGRFFRERSQSRSSGQVLLVGLCIGGVSLIETGALSLRKLDVECSGDSAGNIFFQAEQTGSIYVEAFSPNGRSVTHPYELRAHPISLPCRLQGPRDYILGTEFAAHALQVRFLEPQHRAGGS